MGLDYIRARTGKPWRRKWDSGLNRLKVPTLFDQPIKATAQLMTVEFHSESNVRVGDTFIVQADKGSLVVSNGLRRIGKISRPPAEMSAAVHKAGGYAEAVLQRLSIFGDTGEVSVR